MGDGCLECSPVYYEVFANCFRNNEASVKLFQAHGVLSEELTCPNCGNKCTLWEDKHLFCCYDTYCLPKTKKRLRCGYSVSLFKGSFLDNAHIEVWKILCFINLFCHKHFAHSLAQKNLSIGARASIDWRSFCFEMWELAPISTTYWWRGSSCGDRWNSSTETKVERWARLILSVAVWWDRKSLNEKVFAALIGRRRWCFSST